MVNRIISAAEIIKKLSDLFSIAAETPSEEEFIKKDVCITDPANVCGVYGKTEEAKRMLCLFQEEKATCREIPKYEYDCKEIAKARFSMEYIKKIMAIIEIDTESVAITIGKDFPIKIENKHFCFILAPRVTEEE